MRKKIKEEDIEELLCQKGGGWCFKAAEKRSEVNDNRENFNFDNRKKLRSHLRILPSLVMNPILHRAFLVFLFGVLGIEHFGFVKEFMVKAQDFLVLAECRLAYRCHFGCKVGLQR